MLSVLPQAYGGDRDHGHVSACPSHLQLLHRQRLICGFFDTGCVGSSAVTPAGASSAFTFWFAASTSWFLFRPFASSIASITGALPGCTSVVFSTGADDPAEVSSAATSDLRGRPRPRRALWFIFLGDVGRCRHQQLPPLQVPVFYCWLMIPADVSTAIISG